MAGIKSGLDTYNDLLNTAALLESGKLNPGKFVNGLAVQSLRSSAAKIRPPRTKARTAGRRLRRTKPRN